MTKEEKKNLEYIKEECIALICRSRQLEEALAESEEWQLHWFNKWASTEEYKREQEKLSKQVKGPVPF